MSGPRMVPVGRDLDWRDEDMDTLAQITPEDIAAAQRWWQQHAPRKFQHLLDAQPAGEHATPD